jgi:hypothetical protein
MPANCTHSPLFSRISGRPFGHDLNRKKVMVTGMPKDIVATPKFLLRAAGDYGGLLPQTADDF